MSKWIGLDVCVAVCFAVAPIGATPVVFSYTSGNLGAGTNADSIVKLDASGLSVTATAWGLTGNSATTFQTAALGQYSGLGLGVCDAFELAASGGCQSPQHEVDNNGRFDFVLFQFSSLVNAVTIKINPVCNCDTDVSYFVGNGLSPSGKTLAQTGTVINSLGSSATRTVTLTGVSGGVTSILFGASTSSSDDYFKIESISATVGGGAITTAPEPATFAVVGGALLLIGSLRFRKNGHLEKGGQTSLSALRRSPIKNCGAGTGSLSPFPETLRLRQREN